MKIERAALLDFNQGCGFLFPGRKNAKIKPMIETAKKPTNIFFQWLSWQFFEMPGNILKIWKNFLKFNLNYFSIPLLLKTFFSHWRRYKWSHGRGFDFKRYFEVLLSNLISRILGAMMRSILIMIGFGVEIFIIFAGIILFFSWLVSPILLIGGLIFGIKVIF